MNMSQEWGTRWRGVEGFGEKGCKGLQKVST